MGGDSTKRNQSLCYTYHRDKGHTIEQCIVFKDHLGQLVKSEHLKEFVVDFGNGASRQASRSQENALPPPLGVIDVIHAASIGTNVSQQKEVLLVVLVKNNEEDARSKKKVKFIRESIAFSDDDLEGTTQPHDDALMVTA